LKNTLISHRLETCRSTRYHAKFGRSTSNGIYGDLLGKWVHRVPPFKVTGTDTHRLIPMTSH